MHHQSIKQLWHAEAGVTSIEYAIIAGIIVVAIVVAVGLIGDTLVGVFDDVNNGFPDA